MFVVLRDAIGAVEVGDQQPALYDEERLELVKLLGFCGECGRAMPDGGRCYCNPVYDE